MGLLDELEEEIRKRQLDSDDVERRKADREELFRTQIAPRMDALYEYLKKLVSSLKVLKPQKVAYFTLNGYGEITAYILHDYDLQITTQSSSKEIRLNFPCVIASEQCPVVEVQGASKVRAINSIFQRHHISGLLTLQKDETDKITHAAFCAKGRITLNAIFVADVTSGVIKIIFNNFDRFTTISKTIQPEQLSDDLFDQIGRYLTRDSSNLFKEPLPDSYRNRLRARIQQEGIKRKWESKITSQSIDKADFTVNKEENHEKFTDSQKEKTVNHSWLDNIIKKFRQVKKSHD